MPSILRVQLASSGASEGAVLTGVRKDHPDRLYLFSGLKEQTHAISIEQKISELYGIYVKTEIVNEFDIMDCMTKVMKVSNNIRKKEKDVEIKFTVNITGGTKILSAAMLMVANLISGEVFYIKSPRASDKTVPVEFDERIDIPLPKPFFEPISAIKQEILIEISKIINPTVGIIQKKFKISKQAISEHVKQLENLELIEKKIDGREKIIKLTASGMLYLSVVNL